MATLTWFPKQTPFDWNDTADWGVDAVYGFGPPGAGDTAIVGGTITLGTSLNHLVVQMPVTTDTVEIAATNVDLGDNFQLLVTNPDSNAGFDVYKVIGTGTLDGSHTTDGLAPKVGAIDATIHPLTIDLAGTFINSGSISGVGLFVVADSAASGGIFQNNETIDITGVFSVGAGVSLTGGGTVALDGRGASADITGAVAAGQTISFVNQPNVNHTSYGDVTIADLTTFQGSVNITQDNEIVLSNLNSSEQSYDGSVLTFQNGETLHVGLTGQAQSIFVLPGASGTTIFGEEAACFASGTRIATATGETSVESLRVGDLVRLARGGTARIRWLGHRRVRCARHPKPQDVQPVRVRAGALGVGRPARDLVLSPDHAVFLRGALIPVRYLVNGASIAQETVESVTYWHVELDRHDVLLAEGLPCESFLDTGNRAAFDNADALELHPDFGRRAMDVWTRDSCAKLVLDGPALTEARRIVQRRAATLGFSRTRNPAIRALADGVPISAHATGGLCSVRLPPGTRELRLVSTVWVPAHMQPAETDTRKLGIGIGQLWLDGREVALDSPGLTAGWHSPEPGVRWTDGDASIAVTGARSVGFAVALTGSYWRQAAPKVAKTG